MHPTLATFASAPFFSYVLAHMCQALELRGLLPLPSFSSSSFSRQQESSKATSMEIKQGVKLQINYFKHGKESMCI
jgi:hypothetical protein